MMSIKLDFGKHGTGYPADLVAQKYGDHMPGVVFETDRDNGTLTGIGDWIGRDSFKAANVGTFTGEIVEKAVDGRWVVLVRTAENAAFVYQKPLEPYTSPRETMNESSMYNAAGDIVRTYMLRPLDRFETSTENFNGTPKVGAKITGATADGKLTVATA